MDIWDYILYLFGPIALFTGVLIWVFGRKRKKRFEEDSRIPFDE